MMGAAERYRELTQELLRRREMAGGSLPPTEEARIAADLDDCWHRMSLEEQEAEERALASSVRQEAPATRA